MKNGKWKIGVFVGLLIIGAAFSMSKAVNVSNTVNGKELPIYCVDTEEKKVALSFDAAWGNEDTQTILDILAKYNIHVTFFMTGGWVENYPEDVKKIQAAGHDLGNHSENHKNMSQLSDSGCQEELMKVHNKVKELTGVEMCLFRPPYGDYDNHVITNAKNCGYYTIQWSVDTFELQRSVSISNVIFKRNQKHLKKIKKNTIMCLTREPMTSEHLAAGKISFYRSNALSYQDEGVTFCVICK